MFEEIEQIGHWGERYIHTNKITQQVFGNELKVTFTQPAFSAPNAYQNEHYVDNAGWCKANSREFTSQKNKHRSLKCTRLQLTIT
jgi:hypothetical protein